MQKVKAEAFEDKDQTIYGWSITIHSLQGITLRNPNYFASILRLLRISLTYLLIHITLMLSLLKCDLLWQHLILNYYFRNEPYDTAKVDFA